MTNATTAPATEIRLGAVYTIGTGRRRYLAINRALFGRWDLMALSGAFRGCQPSSVDVDDMKLAKDQTVAFGGAKASWLRSKLVGLIRCVFACNDAETSMRWEDAAAIPMLAQISC